MPLKIARSAMTIGSASLACYIFRFIRNVFLARLLIPEDYGICIALTAVVASAQLITDFGFEKLLVQNNELDDENLQYVLTTLQLARAAVLALVLLALAPLLANLLGVPQAVSSFYWLAAVALFQGLTNLDTARFQKSYRFGPDATANLVGASFEFLIAVVGAYYARTYAVIPFAFMGSVFGVVAVSHLLAERPYRPRWDAALARRAINFGGPLVLSGTIVFLASQADRMIVGASVGLEQLAVYGATMTIVATPGILAARTLLSVSLPILAGGNQDRDDFAKRFHRLGVLTGVATLLLFGPLMLFGQDIISLVFGSAYRPPPELPKIIAFGQAAALLRCWPNVAAIALGDTKGLVISNLPRILGFVLALISLHFGADIIAIALSFACGEVIALVSALLHIARHRQSSIGSVVPFLTLLFGSLLAVALAAQYVEGSFQDAMACMVLFLLFFFGGAYVTSPQFKHLAPAAWRVLVHLLKRG